MQQNSHKWEYAKTQQHMQIRTQQTNDKLCKCTTEHMCQVTTVNTNKKDTQCEPCAYVYMPMWAMCLCQPMPNV